jgi:hypothetical protein
MAKTYHYPISTTAATEIVRQRFPLAQLHDLGEDQTGYYVAGKQVATLVPTDEGLVLEMDSSVDLYG